MQLCGKGFVHKFYLSEHMDYHTGRKRHQCHKCGKKFSSSSILAKHVARHSGRKEFACATCNKAFVIKADLSAHVRLVHNKPVGLDRPVFPAKSDSSKRRKRPLIPPHYSLIKQEDEVPDVQDTITTADGKVVPYYEKPKPVLRMMSPDRRLDLSIRIIILHGDAINVVFGARRIPS